jgi:hypothetical protein
MADVFITKQLRPAVGPPLVIYTVPALKQTVISTILVCNDNAVDATYQITHAIAGAADATIQRVFSSVLIPGNTTDGATIGGTLNATDVVRVSSSTGNVNFHLYGVERIA